MTQSKIEKRRQQIKRNAEETLKAVSEGKGWRGTAQELIEKLKRS
jgi:hypothetical protein